MNRRRQSKFRRRSGSRRLTDWIGGGAALEIDFPITSVPQLFDIVDLQDMDEHVDRMTVERVRGEIGISWIPDAAVQAVLIAYGIYVTDVEESGSETVLQPFNLADQDSELWMWRYTECLTAGSMATIGNSILSRIEVDVKAKRVMEGRQKLVLSAEVGVIVGQPFANDLLLWKNLRALVKLA